MTLDEAVAYVAQRTPLSTGDVLDLLSAETPEDVALLVRGYEAAGCAPDHTGWQVFASTMRQVAEVAGKVSPVLSVIAALAPLV